MDQKHKDYANCKLLEGKLGDTAGSISNINRRGIAAKADWKALGEKVRADLKKQVQKLESQFLSLHADSSKRQKELQEFQLQAGAKNLEKYANGKALKEKHKKVLDSLKTFKADVSTLMLLWASMAGYGSSYLGVGEPNLDALHGYLTDFERNFDELDVILDSFK